MKWLFKGGAWFVAVACVVWIAVLWRWRASQHDTNADDIVRCLVVLPVVAFLLVLAMRWAVGRALETQAAQAARTPQAAGTEPPSRADSVATGPKPARHWHLLGAWAHTAGGASVDELLAAIEAGSPLPRPDASLRDEAGQPVMTARIGALDDQGVATELQHVLSGAVLRGKGGPVPVVPERAVRALASLSPLIDELVQALTCWSAQWEEAAASAATTQGQPPAADSARIVHVLAAWPGDWDDSCCDAARAWLVRRLCDPLEDAMPPARWTLHGQRMSGSELLCATERTLDSLHRQRRDDPVVVLACHSDLDLAGIQHLETGQRLFHAARRPEVAVAGEGAAALALSAIDWPADAALDDERVRFIGPAFVQRAESIDATGRTESDETVQFLIAHCLESAGVAGSMVADFASDADPHTPRAAEVLAVTQALMPDLDANENLRLAGAVIGRVEAVAPLLTLAMAAAQARASGRPALALSLADPHWRMAAVSCPDSFEHSPATA